MPLEYVLTIEVRPTYVHAKVAGPRTPENVMRFFREAHEACARRGLSDVLIEMAFTGPGLDTSAIFGVVSQRAPEGTKLRRIAYVERTEVASRARFAETIAVNRGVNIRLFPDVAQAERWLTEE